LERIFSAVVKRPPITEFNQWGERLPSSKPPIKTRAELAAERGEPWPPVVEAPAPNPAALPASDGANRTEQFAPQPAQTAYPNYGQPTGWVPATPPSSNSAQSWQPSWERNNGSSNEDGTEQSR
jgi:cell division protease FtsH